MRLNLPGRSGQLAPGLRVRTGLDQKWEVPGSRPKNFRRTFSFRVLDLCRYFRVSGLDNARDEPQLS